jgi:hypothetical protein
LSSLLNRADLAAGRTGLALGVLFPGALLPPCRRLAA